MTSQLNVRGDFPALTQKINGKSWVYLDSAASSLKPWPVIERISHFYSYETANIHRGAFYLADKATVQFENTRKKVQSFLGARSEDEIIFTKGSTESINLVAQSLGELALNAGDEILLSEMEHHANIVPWQMLADHKQACIKVIPVLPTGDLDLEAAKKLIGPKTKILSVTHCSNVLGTVNDVKLLAQWAHEFGAHVVVDGAQMVANFAVDVSDLDVDFYVFSAHKLFGPYGCGVLYGKKEILNRMPPYQGGGSMISEVRFEKTTYNSLPHKFEAGTPHIEGVIALGTAIDYVVGKLGFSSITAHEHQLRTEAVEKLVDIQGLKIYGSSAKSAPIVSFSIDGLHPSDIAQILDQQNVAVRAGHLCAQPLMNKMMASSKHKGFVRASISVFNNSEDIDKLVHAVKKAKEMLA